MSQIPDPGQPATPYRPAPLTKERFSLFWWAWIVYFLGAATVILIEVFQGSKSSPLERWVSYVTGELLGMLLMGIIPAVLVFYLSKRSRKAASIAFVILVGLGMLGRLGEAARNGGRTALDDEAVLNRAAPGLMSWLKDQVVPYQELREKMAEESPLNPNWLKKRAELVGAKERIERVRKANGELRDLYSRMSLVIREELAAQGVPPEDRSRLGDLIMSHFANAKTVFGALLAQDDATMTEFLKVCDLLDENWDHWRFDADAGTVVFEKNGAKDEFNAARDRILKLEQEQERDRAEFLRRIRQGGK